MNAPAARRGEVWFAEVPGDKRRPVLVLSRDPMGRLLPSVICAPITSTIRPDFGGLFANPQVKRGAASRCFHYAPVLQASADAGAVPGGGVDAEGDKDLRLQGSASGDDVDGVVAGDDGGGADAAELP